MSSYTLKRSTNPRLVVNRDRLTSAKHHKAGRAKLYREHTFNLPDSVSKSDVHLSDSKSATTTTVATLTTEARRIEDNYNPALRRHKSIRKRLGRFFVHLKRTPSTAARESREYRYPGQALELPAGKTPATSPTTLEEMPASLPASSTSIGEFFELEQPQPYIRMNQIHTMHEPYEGHQLYSQQGCGKQEFIGNLSMCRAPAQVATPKSLPRLAVPGSIHDVPPMAYDQSPHSASTISPNTPVGQLYNSAQPDWYSHSGHPLISPCDTISTLPWYRCRPQQNQMPITITAPITPTSADSFSSSTSLSAYPASVSASFGAWPQPGPEYLRTAFPQRYQPINHESNTHLETYFDSQTWATELTPHRCLQHVLHTNQQAHSMVSQSPLNSAPQRTPETVDPQFQDNKLASNESQLLPAIHNHDMIGPSTKELPPLAYSSSAASPFHHPPAVCEQCKKVFTGKFGKGNLTRHLRQMHESPIGGAIHICRFCMKTYNRADALRKHSWKKHRDAESKPNKRRRS